NMLYFGATVWGDHDMFHSSDEVAGGVMARSKAISGGPIYLSDEPERFVPEAIRPLVLSDGRILRPLEPALPVPESVFTNPYTEGQAFTVAAPIANGAAAVCAYNLTEPGVPIDVRLDHKHYAYARSLLQPSHFDVMLDNHEGLVFIDVRSGSVELLGSSGIERIVEPLNDLFALIVPIRHGWGVLGCFEKYLCTAVCSVLMRTRDEIVIRTEDSLPVSVWIEEKDIAPFEGTIREEETRQELKTFVPNERGIVRLVRK
ncbi:MAG: Sip1-related alpha-galactosidase, partial [Planctomycetota bacterium]